MQLKFSHFKTYLQFLSPHEPISEINRIVDGLTKTRCIHSNINRSYSVIKELKKMRHEISSNM